MTVYTLFDLCKYNAIRIILLALTAVEAVLGQIGADRASRGKQPFISGRPGVLLD